MHMIWWVHRRFAASKVAFYLSAVVGSTEMSDSAVKNLAITEKKVQKPGGCVGIFLQLIDWKRRLAKKKLFSQKLLTPARAKKFRGDEKMPNSKLHLIANENSGGFPSAKKGGSHGVDVEQKTDMRAPSLVARLMGLEYIPAAQRNKSKEVLNSGSCADGKKEFLANNCELHNRKGVDLDMGVVKHDSRPQKLQKTGAACERRAVTRFGAEALHIRSVLSRAKKYNHHHHHPKLASPLKSPRISSGKSASRSSRLIGAATKILEPGLQARKGSLTYPASTYPHESNTVIKDVRDWSTVVQDQSCYDAGKSKNLMGHKSCKNCGNLLDVIECKQEVPVPLSIVSDVTTANSMVSSSQKEKSFTPSHGQKRDIVLLRSKEKLISLTTEEEGKDNAQQSWNEPATRRMAMSCEDNASSFPLKHKIQTQKQMLSTEKYSPGSTMSSNMQVKRGSSSASGTKDFVSLNRSLSGRTRMRSPTKLDSSKFDIEKKPCNRQLGPLSHERTLEKKRRILNVSQLEGTASVGLKQKDLCSDALGGKRRDFPPSSLNSFKVKNKRDGQGEEINKVIHNKIDDVVSFTFNSPLKQKTGIPPEKEETSCNNERNAYCNRLSSPLKADALGAFLEQKLKELTSQEDDELASGALPKKPSSVILQELLSALNSEHLVCHDGHVFNDNCVAKQERFIGNTFNGNQLSPGSVLEASFSSSSLDESSGHGFHPYSMNYSYGQPEQWERDIELSDSATSFNIGKIGEILNQIPSALQCLHSFGRQFTRSKVNNVKDVLLNAELVLRIATGHNEGEVSQLLIYQFLLEELDTMASDAMWTEFEGFMGYKGDSKQRKKLKGFLFDCVVEYLESNCCKYFHSGFRAWTKLPLCVKGNVLAQEVKREVKQWEFKAGMMPDEIIEWEMSHSLGKWTDFDVEAFEAGVDIDGDILQILVGEIVEDLVGSNHSFISF